MWEHTHHSVYYFYCVGDQTGTWQPTWVSNFKPIFRWFSVLNHASVSDFNEFAFKATTVVKILTVKHLKWFLWMWPVVLFAFTNSGSPGGCFLPLYIAHQLFPYVCVFQCFYQIAFTLTTSLNTFNLLLQRGQWAIFWFRASESLFFRLLESLSMFKLFIC